MSWTRGHDKWPLAVLLVSTEKFRIPFILVGFVSFWEQHLPCNYCRFNLRIAILCNSHFTSYKVLMNIHIRTLFLRLFFWFTGNLLKNHFCLLINSQQILWNVTISRKWESLAVSWVVNRWRQFGLAECLSNLGIGANLLPQSSIEEGIKQIEDRNWLLNKRLAK